MKRSVLNAALSSTRFHLRRQNSARGGGIVSCRVKTQPAAESPAERGYGGRRGRW
jgi:hypothetical protein